jgi:hypothetical protein
MGRDGHLSYLSEYGQIQTVPLPQSGRAVKQPSLIFSTRNQNLQLIGKMLAQKAHPVERSRQIIIHRATPTPRPARTFDATESAP